MTFRSRCTFLFCILIAGVFSSCNYITSRDVNRPEDVSVLAPQNLTPTFDSIYQYIFVRQCISCHAPGKEADRVLLDRTSLLVSPRDLVKPGEPEISGLYLAVTRNDGDRMPPPDKGLNSLKPQEIEAIRVWIVNGAKD